jgi:hypothetical protein
MFYNWRLQYGLANEHNALIPHGSASAMGIRSDGYIRDLTTLASCAVGGPFVYCRPALGLPDAE